MIKRITAAVISVIIAVSALSGCSEAIPSVVFSANGEQMATLTTSDWGRVELSEAGYASYVDAVINEAAAILSELNEITVEQAKSTLSTEGYKIETVFDENVYKSMSEGQSFVVDNMAAAVTDLNGKVLSIYSVSDEFNEYRNLALTDFQPCSAFKPLSVYAPAIEKGVIEWSSMTVDSPVKKAGEDGMNRDWPRNASGMYTNEKMDVKTAIKESINTVAVKTLMSYGVKNSVNFLSENFGIDLGYEVQAINSSGEDSVLDNIGLGYLANGVSAVDMAGYYQIFANGGVYTKPYTISRILDGAGKVIYEASPEQRRIISAETAAIMNLLLQTVVENGGTGQAAGNVDKLIGGKTGTGENAKEGWNDNWFVGFTPEYTCAVWHSAKMTSNVAAVLFAEMTYGIETDENLLFPVCESINQVAYCTESGKRIGDKCRSMEIGWFTENDVPEKCDEH